jgi:UDPglucose 6-dehydrogenase
LARIIVIGSGNVGQASGKGFLAKGHEVTFVDVDQDVVNSLRNKNLNAYHIDEFYNDDINFVRFEGNIAMFCVPTPFLINGQDSARITADTQNSNNSISRNAAGHTDLSSLIKAVRTHALWLKSMQKRMGISNNEIVMKNRDYRYCHLYVIRSTIPPLTCRHKLIPLIQSTSQMNVGREIGFCMQPEFLRTVSSEKDFLNPRATVIGEFDKTSGDILEEFYRDFGVQIFRTDLETAEFMKYVQNSFNATKISFANEMWQLGRKLGINANFALEMSSIVGEGYWNPKYGTFGGQPYDGLCLPKDIKSFLKFAKEQGFEMPLLSAVDKINSQMYNRVFGKKMQKVLGGKDLDRTNYK